MGVNNGPQLIKGAFKAHRETNKTILVDAAAESDAAKVKIKAFVLDTFKVLFAVKLDPGPWKYSKTNQLMCVQFKRMLGWKLNTFWLQKWLVRVGEKGLNHGSHPPFLLLHRWWTPSEQSPCVL